MCCTAQSFLQGNELQGLSWLLAEGPLLPPALLSPPHSRLAWRTLPPQTHTQLSLSTCLRIRFCDNAHSDFSLLTWSPFYRFWPVRLRSVICTKRGTEGPPVKAEEGRTPLGGRVAEVCRVVLPSHCACGSAVSAAPVSLGVHAAAPGPEQTVRGYSLRE